MGSQPRCKERAATIKSIKKNKKKRIRGRVQSREGNLVASVMRASSSQAHFVLFSTVESGKKKKLSVEAEKGLSTCRKPSLIGPPRCRCSEGVLRVIATPRSPLLQKEKKKKRARRRKKTRLRKSPLQPQNRLSARAESELLTAGAAARLSNATGCWKTLRPSNATRTRARS